MEKVSFCTTPPYPTARAIVGAVLLLLSTACPDRQAVRPEPLPAGPVPPPDAGKLQDEQLKAKMKTQRGAE